MGKLSHASAGPMGDAVAPYQALFEAMAEGCAICEAVRGPDGRLIDYWIRDANPAYRRRAPGQTVVGRRMLEVRPQTQPAWFELCHEVLETGQGQRREIFDALAERWYDVLLSPISGDTFGQFFIDITANKRAEQKQRELFAELNHRVKNNLTVVASILRLQARTDPSVREPLAKAVDRIHSIADLHALLYRRGSVDHVDARGYLHELCERLGEAVLRGRPVTLHVSSEPIDLPGDISVQVGLVINELVTNAAKHAFPDDRSGRIDVELTQPPNQLHLVVCDDGVGGASLDDASGLGMRLVRSIVQGAHGSIELRRGAGSRFEIRLPTLVARDRP